MRASTSGSAGSRWKNDCPKSPRAMLPTKRANCTGRGSLKPMAWRSTARSASGASGIMSDDRVAAHLEDGERHERHAREHHDEADDPAHDQRSARRAPHPGSPSGGRAPRRGHFAGLAS